MYKNGSRVDSAHIDDIVTIPFKDKVNINDIVVKTTDYKQLKDLENKINIDKKINIEGKCILKIGKPIKLYVTDYKNEVELTSDYIVEEAKKLETTIDRIREQLGRLGDTIYTFDSLDIDCDSSIFVPINKLNELRRLVMHTLDEKRLYKTNYLKEKYDICVDNFEKTNKKSVLISSYEDYLKIKDNYDTIYVDNKELFDKLNNSKCILKLPRVLEYLPNYNNNLLVGELGSVYKYKNIDTDFSLNVLNSYSVAFLHSIGVNKITLSHELNYKQVKTLIDSYVSRYKKHPNLEVIVSGHEEAMICKYNMLKKYNKDKGYLIDRFNNKYKIVIKDSLMYIYNFRKRDLKENYFDIGIHYIRDNFN